MALKLATLGLALGLAVGCSNVEPEVTLEDEGAASAVEQAQSGSDYCVSQGHAAYSSPSLHARKVGWVSYYDVWHHYHQEGNWSLGYVRGSAPQIAGYVPMGILAQKLGGSSIETRCPHH